MKTFILIYLSCSFLACAPAQSGLILGANQLPLTIEQAVSVVLPGSIVVIGENHGFKEHQAEQLVVMNALRQKGLKVAVGMEFLTYTDQTWVDQYRQGLLTEVEFLKQIKWGSPSYELYREQINFPALTDGTKTIALNAPRALTSQIAKAGLNSLSVEQWKLMPPQFTLGRDSYKERFLELIPHIPNPESGDRYFAAQSTWDETMAWQALNYLDQHSDQVLVIVVGEFHVQYGGGLPDRLRSRGNFPVYTFSQVNTFGLNSDEIQAALRVSTKYGPRADWIWFGPAQ
jgi:uncharacterized iron-regulated protein